MPAIGRKRLFTVISKNKDRISLNLVSLCQTYPDFYSLYSLKPLAGSMVFRALPRVLKGNFFMID